MISVVFLDHAFYEFVNRFAAVTRFSACTITLFGFALVAFFRRSQSEGFLYAFEVMDFCFAVEYSFGEVDEVFVAEFFGVFVGDFFAACDFAAVL